MAVWRMRALKLAVSLASAVACFSAVPPVNAGARESLQARYSALDRIQLADINLPTMKMAAALAKQYHRDFAPLQKPKAIARLPVGEVRTLFRAASLVAFYLPGGEYMTAMSDDLRVLGRRGASASADYAKMYEAYLDGRDFEAARALRRAHPGIASGILPR